MTYLKATALEWWIFHGIGNYGNVQTIETVSRMISIQLLLGQIQRKVIEKRFSAKDYADILPMIENNLIFK